MGLFEAPRPEDLDPTSEAARPGIADLPGFPRLAPRAGGGPKRLAFERAAQERGYLRVAGLDEAGRGPLAGPVVAAAVVLPLGRHLRILSDLRDSKTLSAIQRERFYDAIRAECEDFGVGIVGERLIDDVNILQASLLAMRRAVESLRIRPDLLLVDGLHTPRIGIDRQAIVRGDDRSLSVAAASIVAKVTRDAVMRRYDQQFPQYRFAEHKGYPTSDHLEAIARYGPCVIHRRTFRGVGPSVTLADPGLLT